MENFKSEDLEKTYKECSQGTSTPSLITIYCEQCDETYFITKKENNLCQHLKSLLKTAGTALG